MTPNEKGQITKLAKSQYDGDVELAIADHLGYRNAIAKSGGNVPPFLIDLVKELAGEYAKKAVTKVVNKLTKKKK